MILFVSYPFVCFCFHLNHCSCDRVYFQNLFFRFIFYLPLILSLIPIPKNLVQLEFLEEMLNSTPLCPRPTRKLCSQIVAISHTKSNCQIQRTSMSKTDLVSTFLDRIEIKVHWYSCFNYILHIIMP